MKGIKDKVSKSSVNDFVRWLRETDNLKEQQRRAWIFIKEFKQETIQQFRKKIEDRIEELEDNVKKELERMIKLNPDIDPSNFRPSYTTMEIIRELQNLLKENKE